MQPRSGPQIYQISRAGQKMLASGRGAAGEREETATLIR